ncbi:MAG: Flp family type IVb pilin [Actinomycetota bacterium]
MMQPMTRLYVRTRTAVGDLLGRQDGASMVEYALLIALIAMVAIVAVTLVGSALDDKYDEIASSVVKA